MNKASLKKLFEELFSFLIDDFNFKIIKSKDEDWGYWGMATIRAKNYRMSKKL